MTYIKQFGPQLLYVIGTEAPISFADLPSFVYVLFSSLIR